MVFTDAELYLHKDRCHAREPQALNLFSRVCYVIGQRSVTFTAEAKCSPGTWMRPQTS